MCLFHRHTSELLAKVLEATFFNSNIDRNLSTIISDNCSTNDAIVHDLKGKLQMSSLILRGSLSHMRCCVYILNLIDKDGMSVINEEIEKVSKSVKFLGCTSQESAKYLKEYYAKQVFHTPRILLQIAKLNGIPPFLCSKLLCCIEICFICRNIDHLYIFSPTEAQWCLSQEICDNLHIL